MIYREAREGSKFAGKFRAHFNFSSLLQPATQVSFSQPPKVFKLIHFPAQNSLNKNYENPLAPTDFATKEAVWLSLDNFNSQTVHS